MIRKRWDSLQCLEWADLDHTRKVVSEIRQETKAFVTDHELGLLYELARGHHTAESVDGYVMEFGSYWGGSTVGLAMGVRDSGSSFCPVVTVDFYGASDNYERFTFPYIVARETFQRLDLAWDYVCQVVTRTDVMGRFWEKPVRLLFIDSSHTYEVTCSEIELYVPYVVDGGWVVFHDYEVEDYPGVTRAVNEWLNRVSGWEISQYRGDDCMLFVHIESRLGSK